MQINKKKICRYIVHTQMSSSELRCRVQKLIYAPLKSADEYNTLLKQLVQKREMAAVVFVYDMMKKHSVNPTRYTFTLIDKLHSKTIPEGRTITVPQLQRRSLQPRRRIHKIMKGYHYTRRYEQAVREYATVVKAYLRTHSDSVPVHKRIKLAKMLAKKLGMSFDNARFVITHLKRTKFFDTLPRHVNRITFNQQPNSSCVSNSNSNSTSTSTCNSTVYKITNLGGVTTQKRLDMYFLQ